MLKLNKKLEIKTKKNKINQWLEIDCKEKANKHIKNMLNSLKKDRRVFFIEDDNIYLYNTLNLIPVTEFLKENRELKAVIKILQDAIKIQENCINYLIPLECILFDFKHSYINIEDKSLELIILPIDVTESIYSFYEWIDDFIQYFNEDKNPEIRDFISKLFQYHSTTSISLNSLKIFLERKESKYQKDIMGKRREIQAEEKENVFKERDIFKKELKEKADIQGFNFRDIEYKTSLKKEDDEEIFFDKENDDFWENDKKRAIKVKKQKEKKTSTIHEHMGLIIVEFIMIALLAGLAYYAYYSFTNFKKAMAGISIIWFILNYYISKELLKRKNKNEKKLVQGYKKGSTISDMKNVKDVKKLKNVKNMKEDKDNKRIVNFKKRRNKSKEYDNERMSSNCNNFKYINNSSYKNTSFFSEDKKELFETELLLNNTAKDLFLKNNDNKEILCLDKKINIIGRKYDEVDIHINDRSVGRIHAAIIVENNQIFLYDNDSLNGSYINNKRLEKNSKTELKIGDEVSFSRLKYTLVSKAG